MHASSAAIVMVIATAVTGALAAPPPKKPAPVKRTAMSPAKYLQAVRTWHTPAPGKTAPVDAAGRAKLALYALNTGERLELEAHGEDGAFTSRDLDRAAHILRDSATSSEHPLEPRLLDLLYRIQKNFSAQEIRVVSGFRPGKATPQKGPIKGFGSNHSCGRAADIVVPGAKDEDVAKFARELGFVGVGLYPASGFVHVDVRGRSYFWVDRSGPGRRNRERGVLGDLAKKSDARALSRGEKPLAPFSISLEVEAPVDRPDHDALDDDDDDV